MAKPTLLAVNIGNSVTKIGLYEHDQLCAKWIVTTPASITVSEVKTILMNFAASLGSTHQLSFEGSIIASVSPLVTQAWITTLSQEGSRRPLVVGPGLKTGIKLGYRDPAELGADRIAEIIGARDLFGSPLIVVNLETTTTIEVINKQGEFEGGIIAPGIGSSTVALTESAAKIPMVDVKTPTKAIGKSTREALQSGIILGEVARIDGLVSYIWKELGYTTQVIAAGAEAKRIQLLSQTITQTADNLTLHGLQLLYHRNVK